ncbi:unnamed protein product [Polarella glacialis]|uniref:Uncharacterized protein n=1 Tax=Polarella glacialis TaxID=89957 RepID=A0A813G3V2_POLGL|nr:unnamed protein product [Polarella glacialis]
MGLHSELADALRACSAADRQHPTLRFALEVLAALHQGNRPRLLRLAQGGPKLSSQLLACLLGPQRLELLRATSQVFPQGLRLARAAAWLRCSEAECEQLVSVHGGALVGPGRGDEAAAPTTTALGPGRGAEAAAPTTTTATTRAATTTRATATRTTATATTTRTTTTTRATTTARTTTTAALGPGSGAETSAGEGLRIDCRRSAPAFAASTAGRVSMAEVR